MDQNATQVLTNPTQSLSFADSFTLRGGHTIRNRLVKSAMSEQLGTRTHQPKPGITTLYRRWAEGGIGLAITGNIMIDRQALGEPKNVVLDEQSDLSEFKRWAEAGKQNGAQIWTQLNHPGKQVPNFIMQQPVAPSAIPLTGGLEKGFNTPRALTEQEIERIIAQFAVSARLSKQAGFSGVQIHGAHGYLVSQFLSPRHNQRDDMWGGSLENRMRFVRYVYRAIREQVGDDFPVGIKLNSADFMKGGFSEADSMQVVQTLADEGIDLIEISGGTYESPSMMGSGGKSKRRQNASTIQREAYFLDYMEKVRALVDTPLMVTGGFRSAAAMNRALQSDATDLIGLARTTAVDAEFPNKLLEDDNHSMILPTPTTGNRAMDTMAMLGITWYEQQLWRMAKGKDPKPDLSAWSVLVKTMLGAGIYAFRKRRA